VRDGDQTVRIQRGTIEIERGPDRRYRNDPQRSVESWLLTTGEAVLDASIREFVATELAK
jgi:hypothetical protein